MMKATGRPVNINKETLIPITRTITDNHTTTTMTDMETNNTRKVVMDITMNRSLSTG
jgi:hypothetical protein